MTAQQKLIGGKGNKNGVATSLLYGGGIAVALMKPYYLEVQETSSNQAKLVKYADDTLTFSNKMPYPSVFNLMPNALCF